jgi:hypothetical protein
MPARPFSIGLDVGWTSPNGAPRGCRRRAVDALDYRTRCDDRYAIEGCFAARPLARSTPPDAGRRNQGPWSTDQHPQSKRARLPGALAQRLEGRLRELRGRRSLHKTGRLRAGRDNQPLTALADHASFAHRTECQAVAASVSGGDEARIALVAQVGDLGGRHRRPLRGARCTDSWRASDGVCGVDRRRWGLAPAALRADHAYSIARRTRRRTPRASHGSAACRSRRTSGTVGLAEAFAYGYDLRSTFASNTLAAGVSVFELARIMGTSVAMIERSYGTLIEGAGADIARRLGEFEAEHDRSARVRRGA